MSEVLIPRHNARGLMRCHPTTVAEVVALLRRVRATRLHAVAVPTPGSAEKVAHCDASLDDLLDLYGEFTRERDDLAG